MAEKTSTCTKYLSGNTYWINSRGQYHREDGPAVEWKGGRSEWWLHGRKLDPLEVFLILGKQKG